MSDSCTVGSLHHEENVNVLVMLQNDHCCNYDDLLVCLLILTGAYCLILGRMGKPFSYDATFLMQLRTIQSQYLIGYCGH